MTPEELEVDYLLKGESGTVEFKRCGNQPEHDVFETICSFANRSGGNLFLGVSDDGAILGIPKTTLLAIQRNITNVVSNKNAFSAPPSLEFDPIDYGEKAVLRIWVPPSSAVHQYKGTIYDRIGDSDVRLTTDAQISLLYIRKQNAYTERRVFKYVEREDLELDLLPIVRQMAANKKPDHPWVAMSDEELFRSARLYQKDYATGEEGFNLAGVLLLGRDDVVASVCPSYITDAVVRRIDEERYDDRLTITANLFRAYTQLVEFGQKHLPDTFALEGTQAVSPRDIILREIVANSLMHREYAHPLPARMVIDGQLLSTTNASRALFEGHIDLGNFKPTPKNPIIASFFNQIGRAEALGSGTRILYRYSRIYTGRDPVLEEGDVFKASVPLQRINKETVAPSHGSPVCGTASSDRDLVLRLMRQRGSISNGEVRSALNLTPSKARRLLAALVDDGLVTATGSTRDRRYYPAESR